MNIAQLIEQPEKKPFIKISARISKSIQQVRIICRIILALTSNRNDTKMLTKFSKKQMSLGNDRVFELSRKSLKIEDDMEALIKYLISVYRTGMPPWYDAVLDQAIEGDITRFIYPLFGDVWRTFGTNPDKVIQIFQNGTQTLNLLGKNNFFNETHEQDSPLFLSGDRIDATQELKIVKIGGVRGCPLMRVKSVITGTLMTDFIITCVKFWTYRRIQQKKVH